MSFPTGSWEIDANGYRGRLEIPTIDGSGNLMNSSLTMTNPAPEPVSKVVGFWDEDAQKITFIRVLDPNNPEKNQVYTGYMFDNHLDKADPITYTVTGAFEAFKGTGGTANRSLYGWFANHRELT